jgi:hypothetical protein
MKRGHWHCTFDFDPDEWFGFIYRIINIEENRHYIGKKQFFSTTRRKVAGRKNRRKVVKETMWESYTSSSNHISEALEVHGTDKFLFIIESLHETKASLTYRETELQILEDVLRKKLPDGTPMYYNRQIGANIKYIPPEPTEKEMIHMITEEERNQIMELHNASKSPCISEGSPGTT